MADRARETKKHIEIIGLPFKQLAAIGLGSLAFAATHATPVNAAPEQPFQVTESKPQKTTHSKALKIIVPPILKIIGGCESGHGAFTKGNYKKESDDVRSSASGYYQIKDSTWQGHRGYKRAKYAPPWVQDEKAVELFEEQGTRPWYASRHCWAGKLAVKADSVPATASVVGRIGKASAVVQVVAPLDQQPVAHFAVAGYPAKEEELEQMAA